MSDEKPLWPVCVASVFGVIVLGNGISRANKNGTDAWLEMLNVVKDGIFWIFMVLFILLIIAIIVAVFTVTLEKVRGVFVSWKKSQSWCLKIENLFVEHSKVMDDLEDKCRQLERHNEHLESKFNQLLKFYLELKKLTGADVKKVEMDAEREITGNA